VNRSLPILALLCLLSPAGAAEPWATYRGNLQRTGHTDGQAGPASGKVLWAMPSENHFIASPVPAGKDRLLVSGFGGFNVSAFLCLDTDPKAAKRAIWTKGAAAIKLPTVGSPALAGDKLVFGDGMHQNNGGTLHCLRRDNGHPLWQLVLPGDLIHLEGSPTIEGNKVYIGGGAAGVLCVDMNRVKLDGKEMSLAEIKELLDKKWKELLAKYEEDKKKDPMFAVAPRPEDLPKPAPVLLWQTGKDKWHVDAPVAVVDGLVLVASAFLDKEKVGERALFALDAKTGAVKWRRPLKYNPWGGPSVVGKTVVVGGSTASYDPKALKGAKGEVVALNLDDGKVKWRKDVPGGILGCVALTPELAITTATDGKVRAFALADGERKWIYENKAPFFAPAAVAKDLVYVADLKGVVHALNLADGGAKWTLDVGADPLVKAPGMVYGGPVVHGGRLYLATCNLESRAATAVVCIGEK
jgi:outer membrane protein assembly factor BamB